MNEVLKVIMERRSIRKYADREIEDKQLHDIVEAGRYAPTGGNRQTLHFVVITNVEIRKELRELVQKVFARMEISDDQYFSIQNSIRQSQKGQYVFDYEAPVLIVVTNEKGYPNAIAESACALQNMMLEAESLGIGSCWINQLHWLDENPEIRDFLKELEIKEDETICGGLALGYGVSKPSVLPRIGMKVDYVR